jgi:hypothetical protein
MSKSKMVGIALALTVVAMLAWSPAAQAVVNYFDVTKTVYSSTGRVSCPSGWKVTGGGVATVPRPTYGSTYAYEYDLTGSYPYGNGWLATATKTTSRYSSSNGWTYSTTSYSPKVYAICTS